MSSLIRRVEKLEKRFNPPKDDVPEIWLCAGRPPGDDGWYELIVNLLTGEKLTFASREEYLEAKARDFKPLKDSIGRSTCYNKV